MPGSDRFEVGKFLYLVFLECYRYQFIKATFLKYQLISEGKSAASLWIREKFNFAWPDFQTQIMAKLCELLLVGVGSVAIGPE